MFVGEGGKEATAQSRRCQRGREKGREWERQDDTERVGKAGDRERKAGRENKRKKSGIELDSKEDTESDKDRKSRKV